MLTTQENESYNFKRSLVTSTVSGFKSRVEKSEQLRLLQKDRFSSYIVTEEFNSLDFI